MLQLLAGYLKLLGPHTLTLTHSPPHLSHLTQALVQVNQQRCHDDVINQPTSPRPWSWRPHPLISRSYTPE